MMTFLLDESSLKDLGVKVQTRANVLVCTNHNCNVGVLPKELVAHLKNQHNIKVSPSILDSFSNPLGPRPQDIYQLGQPIVPFQGIRVSLGLVCKMCFYACVKRETMRKHFVNHHWGPSEYLLFIIRINTMLDELTLLLQVWRMGVGWNKHLRDGSRLFFNTVTGDSSMF